MAQYGIASGALICALAVVAGAFGAHGLKSRLDPEALALWETAARAPRQLRHFGDEHAILVLFDDNAQSHRYLLPRHA